MDIFSRFGESSAARSIESFDGLGTASVTSWRTFFDGVPAAGKWRCRLWNHGLRLGSPPAGTPVVNCGRCCRICHGLRLGNSPDDLATFDTECCRRSPQELCSVCWSCCCFLSTISCLTAGLLRKESMCKCQCYGDQNMNRSIYEPKCIIVVARTHK